MGKADADRNLLFGLLALQNGLINQGQLVAAFQAWTLDKGRFLAEHLVARGDVDVDDCLAVEALVNRHLKKHGGQVRKSLAAVNTGRSTRDDLAKIGDSEIEATLGYVGPALGLTANCEADRTESPVSGGSTTNFQRFRPLRPHARGGLGAIFVAVDEELHREVALKQLHDSHADDPVSRTRFLLEAEITGGLEHPGIVPVYGLGSYADGRLYYAMRLVRGDTLKEAIEAFFKADHVASRGQGERALALRQLLARFVAVCNAVAYAHSRGVIHRDLKPSNILLGPYGETLVVDWGLAKVVGRDGSRTAGTEGTLRPGSGSSSGETLPGSAVGTPAYMSPEQAAGQLDRISPATDVYSLGATLYHLLTGQSPFPDNDVPAVLSRVQRGDFTPTHAVRPDVPRPLEAVCLKAMALEPESRYRSPRELADEIEQWLAGEPVAAWPEPWSARAKRWIARRRTLVTAACVAAVVTIAALGGITALQVRSNQELSAANEALRDAQTRAEGRVDLALRAIERFREAVEHNLDVKNRPELAPLRKDLLQAPLDFYHQLKSDIETSRRPESGASARLAQALSGLASIMAQIDSQPRAITAFEEAIDVLERLAAERPNVAAHRADLARSTLRLGSIQFYTGRLNDALTSLKRSVALWQVLCRDQPSEPSYRAELARGESALGSLKRSAGHRDEALPHYEQSLAIRQELAAAYPDVVAYRVDLAQTYFNLGLLDLDYGRVSAAQANLEQARDLQEQLARQNPTIVDARSDLAITYRFLGDLHGNHGRPAEAQACYNAARPIWEALARDYPSVTMYRAGFAWNTAALGHMQMADGQFDQARINLVRSRDLREELVREHPETELNRLGLAWSYNRLGDLDLHTGHPAEALPSLTKAREHLDLLLRGNPENLEYRNLLSIALANLGDALLRLGRGPEALASHQDAIEQMRLTYNKNPDRYRNDFSDHYRDLHVVQKALGQWAEAEESLRTARELLAGSKQTGATTLYSLACLEVLRGVLIGRGRPDATPAEQTQRCEANDRAMEVLRQAVRAGYRDLAHIQRDADLHPLRSRLEFQMLLLDMAFPDVPFGR
jgi:serine/threonine-protein kinase